MEAKRLAEAAEACAVGLQPLNLDAEGDIVAALDPLQGIDNGVAVGGHGTGAGCGRPVGGYIRAVCVVEGDGRHAIRGISWWQVENTRGGRVFAQWHCGGL